MPDGFDADQRLVGSLSMTSARSPSYRYVVNRARGDDDKQRRDVAMTERNWRSISSYRHEVDICLTPSAGRAG